MKFQWLIYLVLFAGLTSCQKVINIDLKEGTSQLAVDAFINNKRETQVIRLTYTSGYFHNAPAPAATGATVTVTDNLSNVYTFTDIGGDGYYKWFPTPGDTLIQLGRTYKLSIIHNGETFEASSGAFPVPPVDSVTYEFRDSDVPGEEDGYYPAFYAKDFTGLGNFYWIRSFKNGVFYSKPAQINLCQDAAFGPGVDGFTFILPIRESIIPFNEPLALNDSISVEINSVNPETFFFLLEVQTQTQNGGLFATPPANVSTNIQNVNSTSKVKPVGFFNVAMVSTGGKKIK